MHFSSSKSAVKGWYSDASLVVQYMVCTTLVVCRSTIKHIESGICCI